MEEGMYYWKTCVSAGMSFMRVCVVGGHVK